MEPRGRPKPVEILLAEDSQADIRLTREALKRGRLATNLSVALDGEEAVAFLRRKGKYAAAARPDLILLDLNMPRKDGREVLAEIKADPDLQCIPVVVFSTSDSQEDVARSYRLRANCYVAKPVEIQDFMEAVRSIEDFWLRLVKLPPPDCGVRPD